MVCFRAILFTATFLLVGVTPVQAQIFVDNDATGAEDGTSWTNAYTDLQTALSNATSSDEIWVAEGVYTPGTTVGDSFTITGGQDGLALYGGFAGTESTRSARQPEIHVTVLSGDVDGNDTETVEGVIEVIADITGLNADHVLYLDGTGTAITSSTVIDGVTITGGQATGANGGGMLCDGEMNGCSPTLNRVTFIGNEAENDGGALYSTAQFNAAASPTISNSRFVSNTATNGGAIYNDGSSSGGVASPTLDDVTFVNNSASANGGAIHNGGVNGIASPAVVNSFFAGNAAGGRGGAIFNRAEATAIGASSNPTIENTVFVSNTADEGGAMASRATGAGAQSGEASPTVVNATFVGNDARNGGALHVFAGSNGSTASQITNTILWENVAGNSGDQVYNSGGTLTLSHSIVEGAGGSGDWTGPGADGGGNLDEPPQFNDGTPPAGADGTFATVDDSLNLRPGSPALDAGANAAVPSGVTTDLTGAPRKQDLDGNGTATVNIGAYETPVTTAPVVATGGADAMSLRSSVSGIVNPGGLATTVQVRYGEDQSFGTDSTITLATELTRFTSGSENGLIPGLTPSTTYHYQVQAENSKGTTTGGTQTFTTSRLALSVEPDTVQLGLQRVGQVGDTVAVTLQNAEADTLTGLQVELQGVRERSKSADDFSIVSPAESIEIGPDGRRTVEVAFHPESAGRRTARLVVNTGGGVRRSTVLVGIGVGVAVQTEPPQRREATPVTVTVSGGFVPAEQHTLFARRGGTHDYQAVPLQVVDGLSEGIVELNGTLPAELATPRGIDYYIVLSNETRTIATPGRTPIAAARAPRHLPVTFESLSASLEGAPEEYRMISVPVRPDGASVKGVLRSNYGRYDPSIWRLFRWDGAAEGYRSFPEVDTLRPGDGAWLVTQADSTLTVEGGRTVDASEPYRIPLRAGWNQVGVPFGFAVPWDTVQAATDIAPAHLSGPVAYGDTSFGSQGGAAYQYDRSSLQPWNGYFVYNGTGDADTLVVPPVGEAEATAPASQKTLATQSTAAADSGRYTVQLSASVAGTRLRDEQTWIGFRPRAEPGKDRHDIPKAPPVRSRYVRVTARAGAQSGVPYAASYQPGAGNGGTWDLAVRAQYGNEETTPVHLHLQGRGSRPQGFRRYVLDLDEGRRIPVNDQQFSVRVRSGDARRLRVILGTESYAQSKSKDISLGTLETGLSANYPNPFSSETHIEYQLTQRQAVTMTVYNVLGQRIRTLVQSRKKPGTHVVSWDGQNRYGTAVGSGVYFVRMEAGEVTQTQKMVLVR